MHPLELAWCCAGTMKKLNQLLDVPPDELHSRLRTCERTLGKGLVAIRMVETGGGYVRCEDHTFGDSAYKCKGMVPWTVSSLLSFCCWFWGTGVPK